MSEIWLYTYFGETAYIKHALIYLRMVLIIIVLVGGVNWGTTAMGFNIVEKINLALSRIFHKRLWLDRVIYILVAAAAIILAFDRTLWLPFLGETVLPSSLIPLKEQSGSTKIKVKVAPNTKVAYWAALPNGSDEDPVEIAYGKYGNSGVTMSNDEGDATLSFEKGTGYVVPSGRKIDSHVHYRELPEEYGLLGPIRTVFV